MSTVVRTMIQPHLMRCSFAMRALVLCCLALLTVAAHASDTLSVRDARRMLRRKPPVILVDVRRADEFKSGHLRRAVNIDWYERDFARRMARFSRDRPIVIYCARGRRSALALHVLDSLGFRNAWHISGGYQAWQRKGYPVTR